MSFIPANSTGNNETPPPNSIFRELLNAIKGVDADYTKISIKRAILLLAVPMMLELIMESTFAIVDIYFIGKLGPSAVATVGLTETYLYLLYSLAMGLSLAVTAIVARRIGEKHHVEAAKATVQALFLAFLVSIPFAVGGIFYSKELLALMGADAWAIEHGYKYTQWMLGSNAVIVFLFVINAVFRGAGDAAIAMKILFVANGINIILDPILISGWGIIPAMGIEGAGIATTIGRGVGVVGQFYVLFRGNKQIRLTFRQLVWDSTVMLNIARTSLGGIGQNLVSMTSWIFLMRLLANIGSEAVAGSTIALRILMFTLMPAWGFSNAASTLVGQNLGAGSPERAESSVWKIGTYNMIFLGIVSVFYFTFNHELMRIFSDDEQVVAIGGEWLRILSYSFMVYGWWMVSVQAFNGAGDTRTPTFINIVFFWMIQIPLSYWLAIQQGWAHSGIFWGVFFSETSVGIFTLWLFSRGRWKNMKV